VWSVAESREQALQCQQEQEQEHVFIFILSASHSIWQDCIKRESVSAQPFCSCAQSETIVNETLNQWQEFSVKKYSKAIFITLKLD